MRIGSLSRYLSSTQGLIKNIRYLKKGQMNSFSSPQSLHRQSKQTWPKRHADLAVVQYHATGKTLPRYFLELAQPPKILTAHGARGFDLDTCQGNPPLQDDINLVVIAVAKVIESHGLCAGTGLAAQFLKNKTLKQLPQQLPIGVQGR